MASNSTIVAALVAAPVPPERECVSNLSEIIEGVVAFTTIDALASASSGSPFPTTNNTAAQALATANSALEIANDTAAQVKQRRSSGTKISLPTGDSTAVISWSPEMPDTNYEVRVTLYGPDTHPSAYYGWRVVDGTQAVTSARLIFDNIPAGTSYAWVVESLT